MLAIGDVARRSGVKIPTIRYYEQIGLLGEPGRSQGNQRRYSAMELDRLVFIKHARDLGLDLQAIRDLLKLSAHPDRPCADADRIAADHLGSVREKISRLKRLEAELERIAHGCEGNSVKDCYVIRALASHDLCGHEH